MNKPNLNHLLLDELDKFPITSMASNKMTKPTYCPHCPTELTVDDTTCYQCGEAVAPSVKDAPQTEPEPKRHQRKIVSAIFYVAVLVCAVLFTMWANGEL